MEAQVGLGAVRVVLSGGSGREPGIRAGVPPGRLASVSGGRRREGLAAWSQSQPAVPPLWREGSGLGRESLSLGPGGARIYPQTRSAWKSRGSRPRLARSYLLQLGLVLFPGSIADGLRRHFGGPCTRSGFQDRRRRGLGHLRLLRPRGPRPLAPARAPAQPAPPPSHAAARASPSLRSRRRRRRRSRSPRRTTANMAAPGSPRPLPAGQRARGVRAAALAPRGCPRHFEEGRHPELRGRKNVEGDALPPGSRDAREEGTSAAGSAPPGPGRPGPNLEA